jgi:drug/metabolite transporter (DMT)-like permease
MTFGFIAALAWGVSTVAAYQAAPRVGTYAAVLASQLFGAGVLGVLAAVLHPSLADLHRGTLLGLVAAGLLMLIGWITYYRAMENGGPVGLVSALAACYGGVAAAMAVMVLGERLGLPGTAGVVLTVGGICLAAARTAGILPAGAGSRSAIPLALASAVTYGVGSCMLGGLSARADWLPAALVAYGTSAVALILVLPLRLTARARSARRGRTGDLLAGAWSWPGPPPVHHDRLAGDQSELGWPGPPPVHHDQLAVGRGERGGRVPPDRDSGDASAGGRSPGFAWAVAAGLTEAVALAAFSLGGEAGQVAITAAVSSLYPAIPLVAGAVLFHERLRGRQVMGVALIMAGLVMVGLG